MANIAVRSQRMEVLKSVTVALAAMADTDEFRISETKYGVWLTSCLAVEDSTYGGIVGHAPFSIFLRWDQALLEFRVVFLGSKAQYLNRKHNIKECLYERAYSTLVNVMGTRELEAA